MTDKELLKDCYALLSDILESQNPDNSDEIQEMLNNIDSNCPWIQGKKKKKKKESLADLIIKSCQPIFDAYPNLKALPIYSWGRYYKYELAGTAFECYVDESGFSQFHHYDVDYAFDNDLLEEIDETHNQEGGKLWTGDWSIYTPSRKEAINEFGGDDGRGGDCIIIEKTDKGFKVFTVGCDSPE